MQKKIIAKIKSEAKVSDGDSGEKLSPKEIAAITPMLFLVAELIRPKRIETVRGIAQSDS